MFVARDWQSFEVLDTSGGEKLERWGSVILRRPDPQVIWSHPKAHERWDCPDAHYIRSAKGGGEWQFAKNLPERWELTYKSLKFYVRPTGFKHTGLFPEQAVNWDWMADLIGKANRPIKVLNLFGYTGGASLACCAAGAQVCHVDAAKSMVQWAKENMALSGLGDRPARYIVDDCLKFVGREVKRGSLYDAIVMDPPSYGRGPNGEMWRLEDEIFALLKLCREALSPNPLFFLLNAYTTGLQPLVLRNMLQLVMGSHGTLSAEEVGLPVKNGGLILPCGASGRWQV